MSKPIRGGRSPAGPDASTASDQAVPPSAEASTSDTPRMTTPRMTPSVAFSTSADPAPRIVDLTANWTSTAEAGPADTNTQGQGGPDPVAFGADSIAGEAAALPHEQMAEVATDPSVSAHNAAYNTVTAEEMNDAVAASPAPRGHSSPPPADLPVRPRSSRLALAAAGLVGAILGGAGVGGAAWMQGYFADIEPRMARLEQTAGSFTRTQDFAAAQQAMAALDGKLAELARTVEPLSRRATEMSGAIDPLRNRADQAIAALAPVAQQVGAASRDIATLRQRLDMVEKAATEAATIARAATLRSESIRSDGQGAPPVSESAAADVYDKLAALEAELAEIKRTASAPAAASAAVERLAAVEAEQKALTARLSDGTASTSRAQAAARIVLANEVRLSVATGKPFQDALDGVAKLNAAPAAIAALKPFAAAGAPSGAALADAFAARRAAMLAQAPRSEDTGVIDRLAANAASLVRVRKTGEAQGDDPLALMSQIERALAAADTAAGRAAFQKLPEPMRRAAGNLDDLMRQHAAANAAAASLMRDALAALGS